MKTLIIGPSGAGKTFLAENLRRMNINAIDADKIEGLGEWYDWEKKKVNYPEDADENFLNNHEFLWDKQILENLLNHNEDIYLFGMSANVFDVLGLFDQVFYLKVPDEIILERLDHISRSNPMGRTDYQKTAVIDWWKEIEGKLENHDIQEIDGTLSPKEIFKTIRQ